MGEIFLHILQKCTETQLQQEFLSALFDDAGFINIREIGQYVKDKFYKLADIESYEPPQDRNVYFGVYTRNKHEGKAENCTTTGALWLDFDDMTDAEARENIKKAGLPNPSMLVNSGHGVHAYWLLTKRAGNEALDLLKVIARETKADIKATDKARIMRLPGTTNWKEAPVPCEIIEADYNKRYDISLFLELFKDKLKDGIKKISDIKKPVTKPKETVEEVDRVKIAKSNKELFESMRKINLAEFLQQEGYAVRPWEKFTCILPNHEDKNPSANIYTYEDGSWRYTCHSHPAELNPKGNNGRWTGDIVDVIETLNNWNTEEAIQYICKKADIKYQPSAWYEGQMKKYQRNRQAIYELKKEKYPNLEKYLGNYVIELNTLISYAEVNLCSQKFKTKDNQAVFFLSKSSAARAFTSTMGTKTSSISKSFDRITQFVLVGLLNKVAPDDVPKEIMERAQAVADSMGDDIVPVNFYSFPEFNSRTLWQAEQIACKWFEAGCKINTGFKRDNILAVFGKERANKVFPRLEGYSFKKGFLDKQEAIAKVIAKQIYESKYTTRAKVISDEIPGLKTKSEKEYWFDSCMPSILGKYPFQYVWATTEIRMIYEINGRGRQKIIIEK